MAGLTFSNLFPKRNRYSEEGHLLSETTTEDAARNKVRISKFAQLLSAETAETIYTVPAGKVFFLTGASLSYSAWNEDNDTLAARIRKTTGEPYVLIATLPNCATESVNTSLSLTYPSPIKFTATQAIEVRHATATTNQNTMATIQGWEEDA